jgi:hypothetical protein
LNTKINVQNECLYCKNKIRIPDSQKRIKCKNPPKEMIGNSHGVARGWFSFPNDFDPMWKATKCPNFEM